MHMKRILLLLALTCIASVFTCSSANDETLKSLDSQHIVVRGDPSNPFRSLEAPIFAYYAAGTITLDFVENLGAATVVVQNLTAGVQVAELIDTGMGNVVIDIDSILTVGNYYMTITTMSGDVYYAEFTLE